MEHIVAKQNELASILMGYTVDVGWRGQPDVIISVPYSSWKLFNKQYGELRVNVSDDTPTMFMFDLSLALYNELLCSSAIGKDATLILPMSEEAEMNKDEFIAFVDSLTKEHQKFSYQKIAASIKKYFKCMDEDTAINTAVNYNRLSDWNKLVYRIALSYPLISKAINITWR